MFDPSGKLLQEIKEAVVILGNHDDADSSKFFPSFLNNYNLVFELNELIKGAIITDETVTDINYINIINGTLRKLSQEIMSDDEEDIVINGLAELKAKLAIVLSANIYDNIQSLIIELEELHDELETPTDIYSISEYVEKINSFGSSFINIINTYKEKCEYKYSNIYFLDNILEATMDLVTRFNLEEADIITVDQAYDYTLEYLNSIKEILNSFDPEDIGLVGQYINDICIATEPVIGSSINILENVEVREISRLNTTMVSIITDIISKFNSIEYAVDFDSFVDYNKIIVDEIKNYIAKYMETDFSIDSNLVNEYFYNNYNNIMKTISDNLDTMNSKFNTIETDVVITDEEKIKSYYLSIISFMRKLGEDLESIIEYIENTINYHDTLYAGKQIDLEDVEIYEMYFSRISRGTKSGSFYIYDESINNDRIKICASKDNVGKAGKQTGWVNITDIIDIESIKIGDKVTVNGVLKEYADGSGNNIVKLNATMYVTDILDSSRFTHYYGLSTQPTYSRQGFGNKDSVKKYVSKDIVKTNKEDNNA